MCAVNELSGTIDLDSTLIRAEALFRKFHRLIEAIDKKPNFPAPRFSLNTAAPSLLPAINRPSTPNDNAAQQKGKKPEPPKSPGEPVKVITAELRRLLSKEVEVLPRKEVAKQGDGFLAKPDQAHVK